MQLEDISADATWRDHQRLPAVAPLVLGSKVREPQFRSELLEASRRLSRHGLGLGARWLSELALACPGGASASFAPSHGIPAEEQAEEYEMEAAVEMLRSRDFLAAADRTRLCRSRRGRFLHMYARYIHGERRKEEERLEEPRVAPINQATADLYAELSALHDTGALEGDGFALYLFAAVLAARTMRPQAMEMLVKALSQDPWNWSSWRLLASLVSSVEDFHTVLFGDAEYSDPFSPSMLETLPQSSLFSPLFGSPSTRGLMNPPNKGPENATKAGEDLSLGKGGSPFAASTRLSFETPVRRVRPAPSSSATPSEDGSRLPSHPFRDYFQGLVAAALYKGDTAVDVYEAILAAIPGDRFAQVQLAQCHATLRNMGPAMEMFEAIRRDRPHEVEGLDAYSNILFLNGDHARLSALARELYVCDKFSPEACVVMGNFFSLLNRQADAIASFRRAVRLNPSGAQAWLLLGHEYMELKDAQSAIHAYRRAVEGTPTDFRAWYGLGQAYEIEHMFSYASYYFRQAIRLRPYDSRMWCALGDCLLRLNKPALFIEAYQHAVECGDYHPSLLSRLAGTCAAENDADAAARWYQRFLDERAENDHGREVVDALYYLANYWKDRADYDLAQTLCQNLMDYEGAESERAKSLSLNISMLRLSSPSQLDEPQPLDKPQST